MDEHPLPLPATLEIPANLLSADLEEDVWSWGLSPRVMPLVKKTKSSVSARRVRSRESVVEKEQEGEKEGLEPDLFLKVGKCTDAPTKSEIVLRPKTPQSRQLDKPVKQVQLKPDVTFLTDPGTFFGPLKPESGRAGEPRAVIIRREIRAPASAEKPRTASTINHNKTMVLRADNDQKKPKLALVKELDNTSKPSLAIRKKREQPEISQPKKFKSVPFVMPELESRDRQNLLTLPADKGSKLEALQKRLRYDARKYAKCNIKTGSSSSSSSEEEDDDSSDEDQEDEEPPTKVQKARGSWIKSTTAISKTRGFMDKLEDNLSEADRSIIANLEARESLSVSTPRVLLSREMTSSPREPRDSHVISESEEGDDTSDVSVTAEDIEMFDRWIDGETPTSKEAEFDSRAASIEIQNVLGIDHLPLTPQQKLCQARSRHVTESERATSGEDPGGHMNVMSRSTGPGEEAEGAEEEALLNYQDHPEGSLAGFISEGAPEGAVVPLLRIQSELGRDDVNLSERERLMRDLNAEDPKYEDVLNITGVKVELPNDQADPTRSRDVITTEPAVTLLSTWAPDSKEPASHYSVHHFCTMAVQPQLPRVLHNITRATHFKELPVTLHDVRSETSLSWFGETPRDDHVTDASEEGGEELTVTGGKAPAISNKQLYWTPAPPKMDLPPLFIKTRLFPKYESAIATAEQRELIELEEMEESSTSEEESFSDETDEEDRQLRKRVLDRRHDSARSRTLLKKTFETLGPDKIQIRNHRIKRPGSAPILTESEPHSRYKSDYYTSYGEVASYQDNMGVVTKQLKERDVEEAQTPTKSVKETEKYDKMVRPYLTTPISNIGVLSLSSSYTKLLPISTTPAHAKKPKVTKAEIREVKECLIQSRSLKRSTSTPAIFKEFDLRPRAGSCNDISDTSQLFEDYNTTTLQDYNSQQDYNTTISSLKSARLPVFAHKLGTLLSKDIVLLHQIIKKDNPEKYSEILKEVHRLSREIQQGGDYLHYNKARRGALYVKLGMFKEARTDLDSCIEAFPMMADAYWHRHLIFVTQGDLNTAMNDLTNIIRHNQNQPRVYLARAEVYRRQGDITGAILNYSQALKRDGSNAETYYKRAALFEQKGDILLALEDYTVANRLCPSNTVAILKKGRYNFERGAFSVAVSDFTAMLEQEPYNSIARTYRGRAYAKMGRYENALEDLSCAIHLDPGNHLPFYHRAVLLRRENPKRALQDFSVSILLNPTVENEKCFLHRGIIYADLSRYEEAVPDFETVVELDWKNVEAHINLGLICMLHLKQYKRAIRCFSAAIEVEPANDRGYICRGDAYKAIKKHKAALIDYTRAIHIRPDVARYYLYRGKLLLEMGNLEQASQHIRFASVLTKDTTGSGPAALQKAVVQSFLHNYDDAIFVLDRAAGLDPSPSQYILLGKTYLKAKRFGEAVDNFEKALMYMSLQNPKILRQEMPKSAAEVYFLIGKCHVESGNYPSALDALNSAIRINPAYSEAYFQRGLVRIWVKSQRPLLDFNRALAYNPNYFQAYLTRAAYFGMKGRYSKAMFNCNEALKIQPESVRAYLYRGALKFEIRNYPLAVEDLAAAIKLDPLCSIAYYNRAVCYQHLKKNKEALIDYGIVLLLEKELNQRVLLNRGLLYYQSEDYDNALVDFKLAVSDSPDNALLYHTLGLCYHRNNQLKEALDSLSHAMTLKPVQEHFIQAYISRGNVYMSLNSAQGYKLSKRDYCRALHYDPTNLTAHTNLGIALQSYGKMNEAWKQFTAAINIDSNCHLALEARSIVNLQMGHLFGAFCDVNKAVEEHPTPTMLTNRGVIQQYMKDPTNAMQDFQQAIEADPTYSLAYFNAANLYFTMRMFRKALRYYDLAVKHSGDDEGAVLNRAIAKSLLKDYDGALHDFEKAIELNPYAAHSYFNRGNLHLTMGKNEEAEEDFKKALSLQPNDSSSYRQLAVALGRQFKKANAIQNFKMAILLDEK